MHLDHHTMSKQRGTSHRVASGHDPAERGAHVTKVDGYNNDISPQFQSIIDDWETRLVKENLAHDIYGGRPNHYWIVKNMMGTLMEEMLPRWNHTKLAISQATTKMVELDMVIMHRNVMAIWKKLA